MSRGLGKPSKTERERRRRPSVVIEKPTPAELHPAMVAAGPELAAIGREVSQLHQTNLPPAAAGDECCAGLLALIDRARELRRRHRQAYGRAHFWRRKYERTIGDRECASWQVQQ